MHDGASSFLVLRKRKIDNKKMASFDTLLQRSQSLQYSNPCRHNNLQKRSLVETFDDDDDDDNNDCGIKIEGNRVKVSKRGLETFARETRPIIHEEVVELMTQFLQLKQQSECPLSFLSVAYIIIIIILIVFNNN